MIKKHIYYGLLVIAFLLVNINISALALSSSNVSVSSPSAGYYLPGNNLTSSVTVSGAANNPATVKVYYPYTTYNGQGRTLLQTLSQNGTSYVYSGTTTLSASYWVPGQKPSGSSWQSRNFYVTVTKGSTTVGKAASGYIASMTHSAYLANDSTFTYTNSTSNAFQGVGTPDPNVSSLTYNCLAYAIGVTTSWQWPWSQNPIVGELDSYMAKTGSYASRPGNTYINSTFNGCDVIYYTNQSWGSGTDGHFAKVVAWDATGNPTMISSKWGMCEVIRSASYSPFTGYSYGAPRRYYKISL